MIEFVYLKYYIIIEGIYFNNPDNNIIFSGRLFIYLSVKY